jgi:hypothetical protein
LCRLACIAAARIVMRQLSDPVVETLGTPRFRRRPEDWGIYKPNLRQLFVEDPPVGDLQLPFWSHSEETDGAAYRAAVSAVERRAIVDPVCRPADESRSCSLYGVCARHALDSAARTLEDATASCR